MTKRTISQIEAALTVARKSIEDMEAYATELANARPFDGWVVGFDWGMFLAAGYQDKLAGILCARKFASKIVAGDFVVRNGKGEVASVMRHEDALLMSLELQRKARVEMRRCLNDLLDELDTALDIRDRADEDAQWELAYNRALWEDSFRVEADAATASERKRKASAFIDAAHRESFLDDVEREGARPGRAALDRDFVDLDKVFG